MSSILWRTPSEKKRHASEKNMQYDDESNNESWVELAPPSRGSLCSSLDALAMEPDRDTANTKGSQPSPKSLQSPHVEMDSSLDLVKFKLARDMLPPGRNTDWIWDWSSRPEAVPPKGLRFRPVCGSALTTPPNSPAPSPDLSVISLRHSKIIRSAFFRVEVLFGLVVSNLVTFVLGAAIGFCICKRLYEKADHM